MSIVFLNGEFVKEEEARVPITDRGFLFGDGVFSTLRVDHGCVENLYLHFQRLKEHCHILNITSPSIEEEWVKELVEKNGAYEGIWRLKILITGGSSAELNLPMRSDCQLLITLKPYSENTEPVSLTVHESPFYRPLTRVKSLAYLDRLFLREVALRKGFDDTIVATQKGFLLETAFSNLLWFSGKDLYTPDTSQPLLNGITLSIVLDAAEEAGFTLHQVQMCAEDIPDEAQIFVCNAMVGLKTVNRIDSRVFLRDYLLEKQLLEAYQRGVKKHSLNLTSCVTS